MVCNPVNLMIHLLSRILIDVALLRDQSPTVRSMPIRPATKMMGKGLSLNLRVELTINTFVRWR